MKTRFSRVLLAVVALGGLTLFSGCQPKAVKTDADTTVAQAPAPEAVDTNEFDLSQEPLQRVPPANLKLPPALNEIVELAESGIGDSVLLAYVENSKAEYQLSSDEIVYLSDLGVSAPVIAAMIHHGKTAGESGPVVADNVPADVPPPPTVDTNAPPETPIVPAQLPLPVIAQDSPAPPIQSITYNFFYTTLAPYGSWLELPGSGWCWQPTCAVSDPNWQPYSDRGRWLSTDRGWYWLSDYTWGGAAFHYGRLFRHPRSGWVWAPDLQWGPGWVIWRQAGANCGWAPLPPGAFAEPGGGLAFNGQPVAADYDFGLSALTYTFVPEAFLCDRWMARHRLPRPQINRCFERSVVVNNYLHVDGHRVINAGVPLERVAAVSRSEIRTLIVSEFEPGRQRVFRPERVSTDGNSLVVYRPRTPAPAPASGSAASRGRDEAPRTTLASAADYPRYPSVGREYASSRPYAEGFAATEPPPNRPAPRRADAAGEEYTPPSYYNRPRSAYPTQPSNAARPAAGWPAQPNGAWQAPNRGAATAWPQPGRNEPRRPVGDPESGFQSYPNASRQPNPQSAENPPPYPAPGSRASEPRSVVPDHNAASASAPAAHAAPPPPPPPAASSSAPSSPSNPRQDSRR